MPAQNFATRSKHGPNAWHTTHTNGFPTPYTCHMAGMHWAFMDLGDNDATANARIEAIIRAKCQGCTAGHHVHLSIDANWYGQHFVGLAGNMNIADRVGLYGGVNVGDVLVTSSTANPAHTMVVVGKNTMLGRRFVYVRGFNNLGTLGTGANLQYDNHDRDIDAAKYWHVQGGQTRFGTSFNTGGLLYRVPYANYSGRAAVVRNNCQFAHGAWTYVGP